MATADTSGVHTSWIGVQCQKLLDLPSALDSMGLFMVVRALRAAIGHAPAVIVKVNRMCRLALDAKLMGLAGCRGVGKIAFWR